MNPGEHPLEEEITYVGYFITCSGLPTPRTVETERDVTTGMRSTDAGVFARACWV